MEGYGYSLRVLGSKSEDHAKQLGVAFAEAISGKNRVRDNKVLIIPEPINAPTIQMPPAPCTVNNSDETTVLKMRLAELEKEVHDLKRKPIYVEQEEIISDEEISSKNRTNQDSDFIAINPLAINTLFKHRKVTSQDSPFRTKIKDGIEFAKRRAP